MTAPQVTKFQTRTSHRSGCGNILELVSPSLALVIQSSAGELHAHKQMREVYICLGGKGSIDYDYDKTYPLYTGDVVDIAPGIPHGLSAQKKDSVIILAVAYPTFIRDDYQKITAIPSHKKEERPSFYTAAAEKENGTLISDGNLRIYKNIVSEPIVAQEAQYLFIASETGIFESAGMQVRMSLFDSIIMHKGDTIKAAGKKRLEIITVMGVDT